eukprot:TRINITY_DN1259_c0_g3_i1.p1 TRINITY_DN1259_c0_g3~~TRINITY_DN1259_c0_g3_i1.p1  ORF type:complete len:314 (-),score=51.01 TRINITY_DN1259_c0_g3_i1:9-950(-)
MKFNIPREIFEQQPDSWEKVKTALEQDDFSVTESQDYVLVEVLDGNWIKSKQILDNLYRKALFAKLIREYSMAANLPAEVKSGISWLHLSRFMPRSKGSSLRHRQYIIDSIRTESSKLDSQKLREEFFRKVKTKILSMCKLSGVVLNSERERNATLKLEDVKSKINTMSQNIAEAEDACQFYKQRIQNKKEEITTLMKQALEKQSFAIDTLTSKDPALKESILANWREIINHLSQKAAKVENVIMKEVIYTKENVSLLKRLNKSADQKLNEVEMKIREAERRLKVLSLTSNKEFKKRVDEIKALAFLENKENH